VEKLEKKQCKCNDNKPGLAPPNLSDVTSPAVTYKTNYEEDGECLTCSA